MRVATSLAESVRHRLPALRMAAAPELVCADHMCERFGELCLCRFSLHLERLSHVRHLDLRAMGLTAVPHVWKMAQLETLDLRENQIGARARPRRRAAPAQPPTPSAQWPFRPSSRPRRGSRASASTSTCATARRRRCPAC